MEEYSIMKISKPSWQGLLMLAVTCALVIQFCGPVQAGPPCPFHTIEGVSGGAFTPMACLVNADSRPEGAIFGKPAFALSYVNMGEKNLDAITFTQTAWSRVEFGYAANRLGLGSLPRDIRNATAVDIQASDVWLHHFNLRLLAIEENTCVGGIAMPAVTAGVHFKVNDGIADIDRRLGGALAGIGYDRADGTDFTITATKTIPEVFGRPLVLTAGARATNAAQLGLLGFSNEYYGCFEGNIVYFPTDWLILAYEFRQKPDPYGQIAGLIGDENNWHGVDLAVILSDQTTFCAGWGSFATIANTEENAVWWLQLKHEF